MSKIVTDESGNEVEMFTAEELESQKEQAIEEFKSANPSVSEEVEKLQANLKIAEEEVEKLKNKDLNFANLRKQKEIADSKIEEIKKEIDSKIESAKKEVFEGFMKDHYNESLGGLAGEDEELKKKIEFHYKRIQDVPSTKDDMVKKLQDAFILATGRSAEGALTSSAIGSGVGSRLNVQSTDKKFTSEEKAFTKKLAEAGGIKLEEKDFDK